ncbi:MAG: adenine phosphoribosyltransferase [Clostridiales bacterium]|nr:adenine phosphoribosyltransferase [Clostridiales bacterium]
MGKFYHMNIAGLERDLPLCPLNDKLYIAGFVMFSDVELTQAVAKELLSKVPEFDVILTAESKGIPLAYEMARQSGKNYVVARKGIKLYMVNPHEVDVRSITTARAQKLYLDDFDVARLKGKKVLVVDDVISTGESLASLEKLLEYAEGEVAARCAVLAEGAAAERKDIVFLEKLPLFPRD